MDLKKEIARLKREKNAVLLAHNYQVTEVQEVADHVGDSLDLSRRAAEAHQDLIVFAGVRFMAETAKVLAPKKKVLIPRLDAGCPMADMITVAELRVLKDHYPQAKVVTYVNSPVEVKAESDVCCTSSNAVKVVEHLDAVEIIFVPDQNLGKYVQRLVPNKKWIIYDGFCYVHHRIKKEDVAEAKRLHPQAIVLAHPEVQPEVADLSQKVLSTNGMLAYVKNSPAKEFIVITEQGLLERMKRENPEKLVYPVLTPKICFNMKRTSLEDVHRSLQQEIFEITIEETVRQKALKALNEMLKYQ